jgi:CheY-like chemotaxis protein
VTLNQTSILVVDDEPVVRELLRAALEPAGSRVVEAADGSEAIEVAWREHPDLVLLDVGLPKLSGLDVCRALKTSPEAPRVLLITGDATAEGLTDCGADGIVAKPFAPSALLAEVQRTLNAVAAQL